MAHAHQHHNLPLPAHRGGHLHHAGRGHPQLARGGHVPVHGGPQQPSLLDAIRSYAPPHFRAKWIPVAPDELLNTEISRNTVNTSYPAETIGNVLHWTINQATMAPYLNLLAQVPYNTGWMQAQVALTDPNTRIGLDTTSLQQFMPDYKTVFRHEAALTSLLDATVHVELTRFLLYMRTYARLMPQWFQHGGAPIIPDVGSSTRLWRNYLPDRSARSDSAQDPATTLPRLMGDIKPSYKFHSSWKNIAIIGQIAGVAAPTAIKFKKVLAQVKFYMRNVGTHPDGRALRYGYVITDLEVLLLRFNPNEPEGIEVSNGFPHRGQPHHGINGMLALVLIHLMASVDHNVQNSESYLV